MPDRVVVMGASAGGVEALMSIAAALPADFPAAVFMVLHIPAEAPTLLPGLLERRSALRVRPADGSERYENGVIYIASPGRHMLIQDGRVMSSHGPRENRHRPSADVLFRSAAIAAGPQVIGVVLTGTLDDGTAGLLSIKRHGGIAVVQDPDDAMYRGMPESALANVDVDYKVPLARIPALLMKLVAEPLVDANPAHGRDELLHREVEIAAMRPEEMSNNDRPGEPSSFSCPECGGVLWQLKEDDFTRYRCRVGHAYSPETLTDAQQEQIEDALWSALKTLNETAEMSRRLADAERRRGHDWLVQRFEERERDARSKAETIRAVLALGGHEPADEGQVKSLR